MDTVTAIVLAAILVAVTAFGSALLVEAIRAKSLFYTTLAFLALIPCGAALVAGAVYIGTHVGANQ